MSSSTCTSSNPMLKPKPESPFSKPRDDSRGGVKVVDSKSCRQLYLRTAYTFSRKEDEKESDGNIEKAKKCLGRVKDRVTLVYKRDYYDDRCYKVMIRNNKGSSMIIFRKVKEFSFASFLSMIRRMLSCTAKVDVAEH